jgi:hypothetical protein
MLSIKFLSSVLNKKTDLGGILFRPMSNFFLITVDSTHFSFFFICQKEKKRVRILNLFNEDTMGQSPGA